jgi:hypothetical protein
MRHCRSKDSLPKKFNLSRVSPNRGGKMLRSPLQHAGGIFCQAFQLAMKNRSRNTAKPKFRQREIGGQEPRHLGGFPQVGIVTVAGVNHLPGKILMRGQSAALDRGGYLHGKSRLAYQGQCHRQNDSLWSKDVLPQKRHLSGILPGISR